MTDFASDDSPARGTTRPAPRGVRIFGRDIATAADALIFPLHVAHAVVAWSLGAVLLMIPVILGGPIALFVPFERFQRRLVPVVTLIVRLTLTRWTRLYDASWRRDRTSMYVMNHVSMLDGLVALGSLPIRFCGLENAAHLRIPGYGWLMRMGNSIPVRPGVPGQTTVIAAAARERAQRGLSILAFPEGHRTLDGCVRQFRRGVFFIAREAGLPVVPVAMRGAYHVLHKGTWICKPGHIQVWVGPQIETAGLSDEELDAVSRRVRADIMAFVERGELPGAAA